jgi:transposase-like protein
MVKDRIDRDELPSKLVATAEQAKDPLRAMAEMITDFAMEAEVTERVGAAPHERSDERVTHRNGHRERRWDTRWNAALAIAEAARRRLGAELHRASQTQ